MSTSTSGPATVSGQALQARPEAEVVEHRRPQAGDGPPGLVEGGAGEVLGPAQLMGHHGRVGGERLGGLEVVPEADERLADPVVDLARQVAALDLLGLDGPGGELLQHRFPLGQPLVEAGVLDRPGQQVPDLGQQGDVVVAVAAGLLRVDVEHADHSLPSAEQRHRHQRLVVLAPQLGDVAVPLVLPLVGHHRRLGVERHPARHALAEREFDRPRQAR